jgi:hypothetical protein
MRPFRSLRATLVVALLLLGVLGSIAQAAEVWIGIDSVPEDPPPTLTD